MAYINGFKNSVKTSLLYLENEIIYFNLLRKNLRIISLYNVYYLTATAWRVKLSPVDFFGKCEQICNFLRIWSYLLKQIRGGRFRILRNVRYYSRGSFSLSHQWERMNNDRSCYCLDVFIFCSEHHRHMSLAEGTWWKDIPVFCRFLTARIIWVC